MKINKLYAAIITILLVILLVVLLYLNTSKNEGLFSIEDFDSTNIASIEIIDNHTNESIIIENVNIIKQISSVLTNLKADNVTTYNVDEENPLYVIHIKSVGYYPNPPIGVYKNYVEYNGFSEQMSNEESKTLINLLEDEIHR